MEAVVLFELELDVHEQLLALLERTLARIDGKVLIEVEAQLSQLHQLLGGKYVLLARLQK